MDLPEIRAAVGRFLNNSDLVVAAAVSKNWNASFSHILYAVIDWRNDKTPGSEAIASNARHIQELRLSLSLETSQLESLLFSNSQLLFSALRKLVIRTQHTIPIGYQLEIVRRCPQLRVLDWHISNLDVLHASDVCGLFKNCCRSIESLELRGLSMTDGDVAQLLDDCTKVFNFAIIPCTFKESAFRSLTRHFAHLRVLNAYQSGITSKMTLMILTNCPNLITLHGGAFDARDILGIGDDGNMTDYEMLEHQQPPKWVCTNLEVLCVFIYGLGGKSLEWHRGVLQRIAKMDKLIMLNVSLGLSHDEDSLDGLDLRLEAGLDLLGSLKMRIFHFRGLHQQMDERDVLWLKNAWGNQGRQVVVVGMLHYHPERWRVLRKLLRGTIENV
ncbi:hypothetical protein B0O80DRAFT_458930 [Mortierella sp. GBAus27b]|nr:hypothetical protein B0O80DRAFT_458930 [Mortierella sp. GBAus27b]